MHWRALSGIVNPLPQLSDSKCERNRRKNISGQTSTLIRGKVSGDRAAPQELARLPLGMEQLRLECDATSETFLCSRSSQIIIS